MFILAKEGLRIFKRNIKIKFSGFEKFSGTDEEICKQIIESCWNEEKGYFQVNPPKGNYACFFSRDFGMCTESLINLGYSKKVIRTLEYALEKYAKNNGITVAINNNGNAFDFPNIYSPDSTAYFFRSLRLAKTKKLIMKYASFLNSEIKKFEDTVIDKKTGIVKKEHFSGMRDHVIVKESCYDMIMACVLDEEIEKINGLFKKEILSNTLKKYSLKNKLIKYYWKNYFKNSPIDNSVVGHCNVFPFWLGVITEQKKLKDSLLIIQKNKLDSPLPLKYESKTTQRFIWQEMFAPGWERETVWTFIGMPYIDLVSRIDKNKAKEFIKQYQTLIERNGFVEIYNNRKEPYKSLFYSTETRMLWAAMYLDLKKKLK